MKSILFSIVMLCILSIGCKSSQKAQADKTAKTEKSGMNKTEKGAVVGATSGGVIGAIIGNKSNNTALGAILGAAVGGTVGVVIGNKMDKQAKKMEDDLGKTAKVERVGEGIKLTFNSQLLFEYGKTDLNASNKADLEKFAATLKEYPDTDLLIVGHTDNVGSDAFNQTLSEKRAAAVSNQLMYSGVSSNRLQTQGKGESQATASNDTESGRTQNRRVEIAIYANEKMKAEAKTEVKQ
jgi:outer membrane protein OmpA-like peptidoglycan-associated protein